MVGTLVAPMPDRFLVQIQPANLGQAPAKHFATLAEAEASAEEVWPIVENDNGQIFITDESTGEQRYRRSDGSWAVMSGPIDYSPPA